MNCYKINIVEIAINTRYLTLIQDLSYRRLLDWYYLNERPIPISNPSMLIGLNDYLTDVEQVLNDYFVRTDHGWVNKQIEAAIEASKSKKQIKPEAIKPDNVDANIWNDFIALRKTKNARLTETALNGIVREAKKANVTINDALSMCCSLGWQGFKADWVKDTKKKEPAWVTAKKDWVNEMTGKSESADIIEMETNNLRFEK
jgi:uncharacterized protein YdaU (DUF1376 family)